MDLLKGKYTAISRMYNDYLQSDEYAKHPLVKSVDSKSTTAVTEIMTAVTEGKADKIVVEDHLISLAVHCEHMGFILGFAYALNLIKEAEVLKELVQCQN